MTASKIEEATLVAHVQAARAAWPTLAWDEQEYRAWLTANAAVAAPRLEALDAGEVVLCWSAGNGDPEALRLFERHYLSQVGPALRKFGDSAAFVDEIAQRVRIKLLVTRVGGPAPIATYAFGGSLAGLVRVAAVREALSVRRGNKPAAPVEALDELVGEPDPELRALKARYAADFERAFAAALAELPSRDRHLLRLSISARASIDDIARMYQTHRATAARWLNAARDALAANTRRHLRATLGLGEDELTSLLRLVRTEATRMLATIPPGPDE